MVFKKLYLVQEKKDAESILMQQYLRVPGLTLNYNSPSISNHSPAPLKSLNPLRHTDNNVKETPPTNHLLNLDAHSRLQTHKPTVHL